MDGDEIIAAIFTALIVGVLMFAIGAACGKSWERKRMMIEVAGMKEVNREQVMLAIVKE